MPRIALELPSSYLFSTSIPVRITDLNYGGHVGNDTILSLIHEGRMQFLNHFGYSEKNLAGAGLIMGDVAIIFKSEVFYGDVIRMHITVSDVSKVNFDIVYHLEKESEGKTLTVATAKTGMICFNYEKRKVMALPDEVKEKFSSVEEK